MGTLVGGGSVGSALRNGMIGGVFGAVGAGLSYGIGDAFGHSSSFLNPGIGGIGRAAMKAVAHGIVRGIMQADRGGKFGAGFAAGFISSGFSVGTSGFGGVEGRTAIMAVVGGTVSQVTGGKFANGALSGAFVHMFNAEMTSRYRGSYKNDSSILKTMKDGDIVFGKRALGGLIKITFSGDDAWNTEIVHEQIFYNKGGSLNIGYSDGEWMYDQYSIADQYTFSEVYHVNEVLNPNWFQSGFSNPSQYNILSNNCQDFADYVADKIRWSQGH